MTCVVMGVCKMSRKICEHSLRWILAVRRQGALHKYDPYNLNPKKFPEAIGDSVADFGHTTSSMMWTLAQAKQIDRVGWDKWLQSDAALGYGEAVYRHLMKTMK